MHFRDFFGDLELIVRLKRKFRRVLGPETRAVARSLHRLGALGCLTLVGLASQAYSPAAQAQTEQEIRCMQLQQELAAAQGSGGNGTELAGLQQQIAEQDRIYQGTQAAMDNASCYERLFIFGRALKRTPRCINMNAQVEDARRQLARLQNQQKSLQRGGNRRRQQELQQALRRNGCSGAPSGGGLFDFFGGPRQEYQTPIVRSINPGGRYRSVCVRLCDGFYYPVSYSTYGSRVGQDAQKCQASCAAPAELYVYRNPGQEIEQAISLSGSAYMDLPVALRYRKEFVNGCSCKQGEYDPNEIEAANRKAQAPPVADNAQANAAGGAPAEPTPPLAPGEIPQLDLNIDADPEPTGAVAAQPQAEPEIQITPPPPAAEQAPAAAPPATAQGQSTIILKQPRPETN